jgi:ectoine hydroxylase-related dioxygenase (phytanoyl-CoA dioxygenase family)
MSPWIDREAWQRDGFAIVRGFFSSDEAAAIGAEIDEVHAEAIAHGRTFRHGNLYYKIAQDAETGPRVQMVQWPSYHRPKLDAVRLDPRFATLLEPLIGPDIKQIINQLHWKAPGTAGEFAWHQDSRFRLPSECYRNLGTSYVQTGLAIDPHNAETGGMKLVPRSHVHGHLDLDTTAEVLGRSMQDLALERVGLSAEDSIQLELEPGDLALWNSYLVHGSGTNRSDHQRRFYINGYVKASDCDRGEWAFRDGQPVPLGPEPELVHYEALRERSEPHYE